MLRFTDHYDVMISKANQILGLVKRMSKDFDELHCMILLYVSYVRSLLEYGSIVWAPYYDIHIDRLEAIQRKFLRYLQYRMSQRGLRLDLDRVASYFQLHSLQDRRDYLDLCFFFKIVNGIIISPELLSSIKFHIPPRNTRGNTLLCYVNFRTRYCQNMPYNRLVSLVNEQSNLNFFNMSLPSFKRQLKDKILKF